MTEAQTSAENSKLVVARFWNEVVNRGYLEVVDEIFASDCVVHDPNYKDLMGRDLRGRDEVKECVEKVRTAFPDVHVTIDAQMTAESDHILTRWTGTGTNTGPILDGTPRDPTDERVEVSAMSISRVIGGCIEEAWVVMETINKDHEHEGPGSYICKKWPRLC